MPQVGVSKESVPSTLSVNSVHGQLSAWIQIQNRSFNCSGTSSPNINFSHPSCSFGKPCTTVWRRCRRPESLHDCRTPREILRSCKSSRRTLACLHVHQKSISMTGLTGAWQTTSTGWGNDKRCILVQVDHGDVQEGGEQETVKQETVKQEALQEEAWSSRASSWRGSKRKRW